MHFVILSQLFHRFPFQIQMNFLDVLIFIFSIFLYTNNSPYYIIIIDQCVLFFFIFYSFLSLWCVFHYCGRKICDGWRCESNSYSFFFFFGYFLPCLDWVCFSFCNYLHFWNLKFRSSELCFSLLVMLEMTSTFYFNVQTWRIMYEVLQFFECHTKSLNQFFRDDMATQHVSYLLLLLLLYTFKKSTVSWWLT